MIEAPQSFLVRTESEKAAWAHGFRKGRGEQAGWAGFASTTAHGTIHLAAASFSGPWLLALDHSGVIAELDAPKADFSGPGVARYVFPALGPQYAALNRVYALALTLPNAPLQEFETKTAALPKTTEAERLVVQRIGQNIFRDRLMVYWQGRCPLTGIADPALLRASHIVPWAECESDAERLDVHNGLLLSALWDAAFDRALVSFDDEGRPMFSTRLSPAAREALRWCDPIPLTGDHRPRLEKHRFRLA